MPPKNETAWHALTADEALEALGSSRDGLALALAGARLAEWGPNELQKEKPPSKLLLLFKQFANGLNAILLVAAAVSFAVGHVFDGLAIAIVMTLNSLIGYVQERKAEKAVERLSAMAAPTASVLRAGKLIRLPAREIVPGDVVMLSEGARVPADLRLIEARGIRADESALTGESTPVNKSLEPALEYAALAERFALLHMGTLMTGGEGAGVAIATGPRTEFGKIAGSLASIRRERTSYEKRLDKLGAMLGGVAVVASSLVFVASRLRGLPFIDSFLFAVAAAVSSIPEGLPFVLIIVLSVGVQRMARRNAVIRHLPAVETLGVADVICTDKTGTLTENKMTVREIGMLDRMIRVTGEGWSSVGEFHVDGKQINVAEQPVLAQLLRVAALCNKAEIVEEGGRMIGVGDPTESALVALGHKGGFDRAELLRSERTLDEMPFSSERRFRAILHEYEAPNGRLKREIMMVGAIEAVLSRSGMALVEKGPDVMTPDMRARFEAMNSEMAGKAQRVLAVAVREVDADKRELQTEDLRDLTALGLVGMIDPPRKEIAEALSRCRAAGIRIVMMTGDHRATAVAIAREVGLLAPAEDEHGRVFTDSEVASMDDEAFSRAISGAAVFARVSPQTKLRAVRALKALGHTVAVTGDGINDAPALKSADVGVAMGMSGTDVTREVADMVLSDDNFLSIVGAVEEGRIVFRNVKQTTGFLVMTNAGEIVTILATQALGLPLPLLPVQLLWLNVVTDALTDEALALEPKHGTELARPPRRKDGPVLSKSLWLLTALSAALMAGGTIAMFRWADGRDGLDYARSVAFLSMAFFQLWNIFGMRSSSISLFRLGFFTNRWVIGTVMLSIGLTALIMYAPALQPIFRLAPLGWKEWLLTAAVSSTVVWLVEGYKILVRRGIVPLRWQ